MPLGFMRVPTLTLLIFALLSTSCAYQYRFNTGLPESGREVTRWVHIAGWGWSTPDPIDLEEICPEGVARFGSHVNFLNWLSAFFTLGIYSPRTVVVRCAAPAQEELR